MEWVRPEILWGLFAVLIPVLIHLLQLRRFRTVSFSNVSFLENVKKETRSTQRLRNLLLLLLRIIAISSLVIAFAGPYIPFTGNAENNGSKGNAVSIYLDTSPSIDALGELGPVLQVEKTRASEIVDNYSETDKFHIITNAFSGKDAHFLSKQEAIERISSVQTEPFVRNIEAVVARASDQLSKASDRNQTIYLLSDLQKSSHLLSEDFKPDTNISIHFLPYIANDRPNVWIDSAWFNSPIATSGDPAKLHVRLKHNALQRVDGLGLQLDINNERTAISSFNLSPGIYTDTVLHFTHGKSGFNHAIISIEDSPITFDDTFYLGYEVVQQIDILQLSDNKNSKTSLSIQKVFLSSGVSINLETVEALPDFATTSTYDLIIVNAVNNPSSGITQSLVDFTSNGGTVLIIPDSVNNSARAELLRTKLGFGEGKVWDKTNNPEPLKNIKFSHPLFNGVFSTPPNRMDMPVSDRCISRKVTDEEEVLGSTSRGLPFLSRVGIGEGSAFLLSISLEQETGNFIKHAIFVPILLRLSEVARSAKAESITLKSENKIFLNFEVKPNEIVQVRLNNSDAYVLPEIRTNSGSTRILLGPQINTPGNYTIEIDSITSFAFGINADRVESDPSAWDVPGFKIELSKYGWNNTSVLELADENISSVIMNVKTGTHLWWQLIILVIIALAGETILQKRWKHK
jgi:hypothetical protein